MMANRETIDLIEDGLGREGFTAYCKGNIWKYLARFEHKNGVEDLKKAEWYLQRLIKLQGTAEDLGLIVPKHTKETVHE